MSYATAATLNCQLLPVLLYLYTRFTRPVPPPHPSVAPADDTLATNTLHVSRAAKRIPP